MNLAAIEPSAKPYFMPVPEPANRRPTTICHPGEALLREARTIMPHLRRGDFVANSKLQGWMLARAGISLSQELVAILKKADKRLPRKLRALVPKGVLQPQNDGLPGIGESQSWRWHEIYKRQSDHQD